MSKWGYHLIVNAGKCLAQPIRSANTIQQFSKTLVKKIDMIPYGEPQIVMFGTGNKKGYTLVQLIETSNICAHFVEETNDMYLDVFSCKPFDPAIVTKNVHDFFRPNYLETVYLERGVNTSRAQLPCV